MKGRIIRIITAVFLAGFLCACDNSSTAEIDSSGEEDFFDENEMPVIDSDTLPVLQIATLRDVPAMGMVKMLDDSKKGVYDDIKYEAVFFDSTEQLINEMVNGDINIANISPNAAVELYDKTDGQISVAAINADANQCVVERQDQLNYFDELRGCKIYAYEPGNSINWVMPYLLKENYIDVRYDAQVNYVNSYESVLGAMMNDDLAVGVLPFFWAYDIVRQYPDADFSIAFGLPGIWADVADKKENNSSFVSGVTVVKNSYLDDYWEDFEFFLSRYKESVAFARLEENFSAAAALIDEYGIIDQKLAEETMPYNGIVCITGEKMQERISGFLEAIYEYNPELMPNGIPADNFYYISE